MVRTDKWVATKTCIEAIVTSICFLVSLINSIMLLVSTIVIVLYLLIKYKNGVGAVKSLVFITIRTIINPGLAVSYSSISLIKWGLILFISGLIWVICIKKHPKYNKLFFVLIISYFVFIVIESIFFSGYPIVSMFKAFSWTFVFCAVILAVVNNPQVRWIEYIAQYLNVLIVLSPIAYFLGIAYLRNGHAFQGLTNQPNMFGIITCLTFALNMHLLQDKWHWGRIAMLILSLIGCILSESRTGLLSIVICVVIYVWFGPIAKRKKIGIILLGIIGIAFLLIGFGESILSFIYKGRSIGNLLYSRQGQIANAITKFNSNKWFGTGFMVPFSPGSRSFLFTFSLAVEPGNIILALLGDTGIIGTIFFVIVYTVMFVKMNKKNIILFFVPLIASMGEMIFFSTNNIAILYYVLYAVCLISNKDILRTGGE